MRVTHTNTSILFLSDYNTNGRCTFPAMHVRHFETLSLPTTLVSLVNLTLVSVLVVTICCSVFINPTQFGSMLAFSLAISVLFPFLLILLCFPLFQYTRLKQNKKKKKISIMGLSNIPNLAEGVLPALVVNTVLSVVLLKNMLRSVLEAIGMTSSSSSSSSPSYSQNMEEDTDEETERESWRRRRVSITQYKVCGEETASSSSSTITTTPSDSGSIVGGGLELGTVECCVCLFGFEANQEVSELPCKHFFHRACLDKWFDNKQMTCPLCRSMD